MGSIYTQMLPKTLAAGAPPAIARKSAFGACQSDTPSWKWYYRYSKMGSIHIKMLLKALAAGAPPQTPEERGRTPSTRASLTRRGGASIPIFAPGARNPQYATARLISFIKR